MYIGTVLLTGDFNATPASAPYRELVGDPAASADGTFLDTFISATDRQEKNPGTFGRFTGKARRNGRIDWVLCSEHFLPRSCEILLDNRDRRYPSDHFPVLAVVTLR